MSPDGENWISCRPGFFMPVKVMARLFRRLFLEGLAALHRKGSLRFFGELSILSDSSAFADWLAPFRKKDWIVYAKPPFGGPEAVLAYLSRYTHRVAIANSRLISADAGTVAFRWKDYRIKHGDRMKIMRLDTNEFIRRFLIHILPDGFHRIRHYGILASAKRKVNVARIRTLIDVSPKPPKAGGDEPVAPLTLRQPCPDCGGRMRIIETFRRGKRPSTRAPPFTEAA